MMFGNGQNRLAGDEDHRDLGADQFVSHRINHFFPEMDVQNSGIDLMIHQDRKCFANGRNRTDNAIPRASEKAMQI